MMRRDVGRVRPKATWGMYGPRTQWGRRVRPKKPYRVHLKIEFRSNSHVKIAAEIVMVGDEGFSCGTARYHVHHRRLDFQEVIPVSQ